MEQIKVLTSRFNLSLGFLPIAITLILAWFIDQAVALYIGTGVGLVCCVIHKRTVFPFILYSTTGVLSLFLVGSLFVGEWCPPQLFPLMAEIGVLVPPLIIFANRKRLARCSRPPQEEKKTPFVPNSRHGSIHRFSTRGYYYKQSAFFHADCSHHFGKSVR